MENYKKAGASKSLQRSHGYRAARDVKLENKTRKALNSLERNINNPKYTNKQRAKDYDTAIRGLSRLKGQQIVDTYYDADKIRGNEKQIKKLKNKKASDKTLKKIEQLTTDNKLMRMKISESSKKYDAYANYTNQLIDRMSNDKMVTYTTRFRALASTEGDHGYYISGTDYKVRANTKRRSNSSKYNDPKKKKQYNTELNKYETVYMPM